jgi:hypothetical protein
MNPEIKEMDDSYANAGANYASLPAAEVPITVPDGDVVDASIVIGAPTVAALDPSHISVFANSINPVSYANDSAIVAFDVVFSVGIVCPDSGRTETFQVVKRIGVDRMKMANDAKSTTPVSIVEAKKPVQEGGVSTARFRALAGLK